jgi:hypothetical protein
MKTVALVDVRLAARAMPWAWLPAEAVTTPFGRSAAEIRDRAV